MYYVATKIESNKYIMNEFDNLNSAFKFYLEDPAHREIFKKVDPKVTE